MGPTWPQAEGFVLGVGANMFKSAGPVIVYGTVASVVYGIIYYFCQFVFWRTDIFLDFIDIYLRWNCIIVLQRGDFVKIKEVIANTGLTDRAIRLYIENGLVTPENEKSYNGRNNYNFTQADVECFEKIALLRKADFSRRTPCTRKIVCLSRWKETKIESC